MFRGEVNRHGKKNKNKYVVETVKQIQPFNYDTGGVLYAWFIGIVIISISLYVAFMKRKEKDINKV